MSEKNDEYFQQFVGQSLGRAGRYRIKGKKLSAYAKAIGDTNPKYYVEKAKGEEKTDYSGIVAHPAYAATYTVPGLLMSLPEIKDSDGKKLVKNLGKLLHTAQEYNYEGCEPLTPETRKVYTEGKVAKMWLKKKRLWVIFEYITTNKDKTKNFCNTTITGCLREGGF